MRTAAFIVAIVLGIVAAVGVRSYLVSQERKFELQQKPVEVVVARRSIRAGEALSRDMVALEERPAASLSGLDVTRLDLERYLGRTLNANIDRGSALLVTHFTSREPELASRALQPGRRALTIGVDATSGVAGLVRPGDSVDIIATMTVAEPGGGVGASSLKTWRVLSDVTVLAVDDRMSALPEGAGSPYRAGYSTLTLSVSPEEAQLLVYLREHARLTFALRSREEVGQAGEVAPVDAANVMKRSLEANRARQQEIEKLKNLPAPSIR